MSTSIKEGEFPLVCVVQPAVLLAFISTSAIPSSFRSLPGTVAGLFVGSAMVSTALVRFASIHFNQQQMNDPRSTPLLGPRRTATYTISRVEKHLFIGTMAFLLFNNFINEQFTDTAMLAIALLCSQSGTQWMAPVLSGFVVGALAYLSGTSATYCCEIAAVTTGILFQSLASQCLPLWDFAGQSKLGFNISSLALVTLFISASTLQLAT